MYAASPRKALRKSWPLITLLTGSLPAHAVPFTEIRIGDADGFGFETGAGLRNFEGDPVNVDGSGVLGPGDFMPDLNQDGLVMHFHGDDFNNRSAGELGGSSTSGNGFTDTGSTGSGFTDLSLSQSYDDSGLTNFPDSSPDDRNDAHFEFDFSVQASDLVVGDPVFFNIVFGDIGLVAGDLDLTLRTGTRTKTLSPIDPNVEDGLIRGAFVALDFADVFATDGSAYDGLVSVDLVTRPGTADGDPFYGIDYVELSQTRIGQVPAPGTLALLLPGEYG